MNVYVFQAALLCEDCGKATCDQLRAATKELHPGFDEENESTFDSDYFPKGPYPDGGGEADYAAHCAHCRVFLDNPLTPDGAASVREAVEAYDAGEGGDPETIEEWRKAYPWALAAE